MVEEVLAELDDELGAMYSPTGRRSVPPEALLKATVLMAMYSIRSERAFCERLNYDLLFKRFLDLPIDARAFDATTFTKNRTRLLDAEIAGRFFEAVVRQARLRRCVSSEHFSVDGALLEAWASHKSFKPKDRNGGSGEAGPSGRNVETDWRGQKRSNATHESTTDPEARLYRKSLNTAARLCYSGHLLMENRNALIIDAELATADGYAERATALDMLGRLPTTKRRRTVGADKGYDTAGFVADARQLGFTPRVAQHTNGRRSAIDGRTTRHAGHQASQRARPRIEEPFGWIKTRRRAQAPLHRQRAQPGLVQDDRRRLQPPAHHHPRRSHHLIRRAGSSQPDPRARRPQVPGATISHSTDGIETPPRDLPGPSQHQTPISAPC